MPSQQNKKELSSKEIDWQLKHYLPATENKLLKVKIKGVKNISINKLIGSNQNTKQ